MQGKQRFEPSRKILITLEQFIPANHFLRKVDRNINLNFVRKLTAKYYCHNNGRPSIDPEVFFRMILIGYFYGIQEDRKLCQEIQYNLAYRWFCRINIDNEIPDHSALSKIRDRYGEAIFEGFFYEIVAQCRKAGLVQGQRVITDSTLMLADAALDSIEQILDGFESPAA